MYLLLATLVCLIAAAVVVENEDSSTVFSLSENVLAVAAPNYAELIQTSFKGFLLGFICLAVGALALVPIERFDKSQLIALAAVSCYMFTKHTILQPLSFAEYVGLGVVLNILLWVLMIGICVLCLNDKFRRLFGSIGGGYVLAYELVLLLGMSNFFLYIFTMVLGFAMLVLTGKFSEKSFGYALRAINAPFLVLIFINNVFFRVLRSMHSVDGSVTISWMTRIMLFLSIVGVFLVLFYKELIRKKANKVMNGKNNKEEEEEKV